MMTSAKGMAAISLTVQPLQRKKGRKYEGHNLFAFAGFLLTGGQLGGGRGGRSKGKLLKIEKSDYERGMCAWQGPFKGKTLEVNPSGLPFPGNDQGGGREEKGGVSTFLTVFLPVVRHKVTRHQTGRSPKDRVQNPAGRGRQCQKAKREGE